MSNPRFTGNVSNDPKFAAKHEERRRDSLAYIARFAQQIDPGITQSAPRTSPYRQQDAHSCFYASLIGVRQAYLPSAPPVNEGRLLDELDEIGLMTKHGAATFSESLDDQAAAVRSGLGLDITFIEQTQFGARLEAVTTGILERHKPVIFGVQKHWIALDGFLKQGENLSWIGMDPARGVRLEEVGRQLSALDILNRLDDAGLPVVVVDGVASPRAPRFRRSPDSPQSSDPPRFRGRLET